MHHMVKCDCCGREYVYESSPMIKDSIWKKISNEHWEGDKWVSELFCLECMEKKLGRKIAINDLGWYADCYHNQEFLKIWKKKELK